MSGHGLRNVAIFLKMTTRVVSDIPWYLLTDLCVEESMQAASQWLSSIVRTKGESDPGAVACSHSEGRLQKLGQATLLQVLMTDTGLHRKRGSPAGSQGERVPLTCSAPCPVLLGYRRIP